MKSIRAVRPSWDTGLVIICRKCEGYTRSLRGEIKDAVAAAGLGKRVRVIKSSCLDLCPKRATTLVTVTSRGNDALVLPGGRRDAAALAALVRRFEAPENSIPTRPEPSNDPLR